MEQYMEQAADQATHNRITSHPHSQRKAVASGAMGEISPTMSYGASLAIWPVRLIRALPRTSAWAWCCPRAAILTFRFRLLILADEVLAQASRFSTTAASGPVMATRSRSTE